MRPRQSFLRFIRNHLMVQSVLMRIIIILLTGIFLISCQAANWNGGTDGHPLPLTLKTESISHQGRQRSFHYFAPESGRHCEGIVLFFHGHGDSGRAFLNAIDPEGGLSRAYRWLFVYPEGIKGSWNSGHGFGFAHEQRLDDVGAVAEIVRTLRRKYNIAGHLFLVGYSNGACFAYRLAVDLETRFAEKISAFAPLSGTIGGMPKNENVLVVNEPRQVHAASVFAVHGYLDQTIPLDRPGRDMMKRWDVPFAISTGYWIKYIGNESQTVSRQTVDDAKIEKTFRGLARRQIVTRIYKHLGHVLPIPELLPDVLEFFLNQTTKCEFEFGGRLRFCLRSEQG